MSQKSLSNLAKLIIIMFALLGVTLYGLALPLGAESMKGEPFVRGENYLIWVVFMELMVIPDYAVLVFAWKIADSIKQGKAFGYDNAGRFKCISLISLVTSVYFLLGSIILFLIRIIFPLLFIVSCALTFIGLSVSGASAILSYMCRKAADIEEENRLTI